MEGARPEIVAYGLRNPWRFAIDAKTKTMLIADVGEGPARKSTASRSTGWVSTSAGRARRGRSCRPKTAAGNVVPLSVRAEQPTSFGLDGTGRVYVTTATGTPLRLDIGDRP
jgi:hypothetical protein